MYSVQNYICACTQSHAAFRHAHDEIPSRPSSLVSLRPIRLDRFSFQLYDDNLGHSYFFCLPVSNSLLPWSRKFPCPRLHQLVFRQPPSANLSVAPVDIIANSQVNPFDVFTVAEPFSNLHWVSLVPFCPTTIPALHQRSEYLWC